MATGSGCIGLALAYHLPQAQVIATDKADTALALAHKNSTHNNIHNIRFIQSDLFNNLPTTPSFDLIVTNPPYIAESERTTMDDAVLNWEDHSALFAPDNGLSLIKKIIIDAPAHIAHNEEIKNKNIPQLIIEIGYQQGLAVQQLMIDAGYNAVSVYKDIEKKDRVVVGRTDYVANTTS